MLRIRFCAALIKGFDAEYRRQPTCADIERELCINAKRGFPGMFGSLDCTHVEWKNCPTAWHGMFKGKEKKASIVIEAVASQDLWIWQSYIGTPGSNNDINIVNKSALVTNWLRGRARQYNFTVGDAEYVL